MPFKITENLISAVCKLVYKTNSIVKTLSEFKIPADNCLLDFIFTVLIG